LKTCGHFRQPAATSDGTLVDAARGQALASRFSWHRVFRYRLADLVPPPLSSARGPPTDWGELVQMHDERAVFQGRIDELPVIDIHSL
jgi:hypothetical protein